MILNGPVTGGARPARAPCPSASRPPIDERAIMMKRTLLVLLPLAAAACADTQGPVATAATAPVLSAASGGISGAYIVVVRDGADPRSVAAVAGASPRHVYGRVLNGFAAELSVGQLNALRHNPSVEYIEQDGVASITTTQTGATWGLDRTDQGALPLSGTYTYATTAANVHAYVIDSGVRAGHTEFGGRASQVFNSAGGKNDDCNGHGTHVAGTVGGTLYGIAKEVSIYGIKVLACSGSGSWSGVIAGMDWVAANHQKPAVANMSLSGGSNASVNAAAVNLMSAGVHLSVAASNDGADACNYSPANAPGVMTVAASNSSDGRPSWSNFGTCVDLYAPGVGITSAWHRNDNATNTISGTSMASPHVAGVAALYKATFGDASQATIDAWLTSTATVNAIAGNPAGTPNLLLFKGAL